MNESLLEVKNLHTWFPVKSGVLLSVSGYVKAVNGVSFSIQKSEVVSVVGESGCGKSTLIRTLCGLEQKHDGEFVFKDAPEKMQMVFQNPNASLNPRHTIFEILKGPLKKHKLCEKSELRNRCKQLLEQVGLPVSALERFPHSFSGGQKQRIAIARALAMNPSLLVCDEVTAALDVSVQAQIIELLQSLKEKLGLSLLFISHDLSLVRAISDQIHVMYLGKIVESASSREMFELPKHPYTRALIDAIPLADSDAKAPIVLQGEIPSPLNLPKGCFFAGRCPLKKEQCLKQYPPKETEENRSWNCFYSGSLE